MELKNQIALGVSATLGTLLLYYVYKSSTAPPSTKKERSKARKLLSDYKPRPSLDDIKEDNTFNGRVVSDNQVSEGGIVYHDIRYPEEPMPEAELVVVAASSVPTTGTAQLVTEPIPDEIMELQSEDQVKISVTNGHVNGQMPETEISSCNEPPSREDGVEEEKVDHTVSGSDKENLDKNSFNSQLAGAIQRNGIQGGQPPTNREFVKTIVTAKDRVE